MTTSRIVQPGLAKVQWILGLALCASLCLPATSLAQRGGQGRGSFEPKTGARFLAAFSPATLKSADSIVRVRVDGKDVALGTVVGSDGWILTLASELHGKLEVRLHNGDDLEAKLVGKNEKHDLALLKVEALSLKPVDMRPSKEDPVGSWVVSPGADGKPAAVGVIGV